ncbi:MAG: hypothetical protein AB8B62_11240 [Roseobacter sp.]
MSDHPTKSDRADLGGKASNALNTAADLAYQQAEAAANTATRKVESKVSNAASAANAASAEFENGSLQEIAADQIATHLQDVAGILRETDLSSVSKKATTFARENPVLFLGGAALLGFAATRFLKSSDTDVRAAYVPDTDPWTGHLTDSPHNDRLHPARTELGQAFTSGRADR